MTMRMIAFIGIFVLFCIGVINSTKWTSFLIAMVLLVNGSLMIEGLSCIERYGSLINTIKENYINFILIGVGIIFIIIGGWIIL
jgi:hypothetical protein